MTEIKVYNPLQLRQIKSA